jgi:calcyphosin
LIDIFRKRVL